jgi:hypothetical protein
MNTPNLVGAVVDYLAALSSTERSTIGIVFVVTITAATAFWVLARLTMSVIKKIAPHGTGMIDAAARYTNTRGRNRSRDKLCAAIADKGTAQQMLQALREINQISPMDAPDSSIYLGTPPHASIPAQRAPSLPEASVVIIPGQAQPRGERTP